MSISERLRLYRKWWKTWGTLPVNLWVEAAAQYRAGNYAEAEECYRRGLARHRRHPATQCAKMDLAYCCFRLRKFEEAETLLREVIAISPQAREAYLRLAQVQSWLGMPLEAAWTMRRAIRNIKPDAECIATFLNAVLDNDGPAYLLQEAIHELKKIPENEIDSFKLQIAHARLAFLKGDRRAGREQLDSLVQRKNTSVDAIIALSEALLAEGDISGARIHLNRALQASPQHPRVLSMISETYLRSGESYNAAFAVQLATSACQMTEWSSPRDMHVLAEAFYHSHDKMSALLMASKAKTAGSKLLGEYRDARMLDKLIESLSSGSLA